MRFWMTLVAICIFGMARTGTVARAADAAEKTVSGELVDTHCCADGASDKHGEGHAACCKKCLAGGKGAGLLVDGKVWKMETDGKALADYAAQTIRVTGTIDEAKQSVKPSKIEVKDGDNWKEIKLGA